MIISKKDLKKCLRYERDKNNIKNIYIYQLIGKNERALLFQYTKILRKLEYYLNNKKMFKYRLLHIKYKKLSIKYGIHIPLNSCDVGLYITHIGPILINCNTKIGKDCYINTFVKITNNGYNNEAANIGDHCILGVGSTIIGGVNIGSYSVIGANSLVTKSFPNGNCTIAGSPAKIISNKSSREWYYNIK